MKASIFSKDEIKDIKERLPRGSIIRIANRLGRDYSGVRRVLSGKAYSHEVIAAALEECEKNGELRRRFDNIKQKAL
jgi:hypothetical protein